MSETALIVRTGDQVSLPAKALLAKETALANSALVGVVKDARTQAAAVEALKGVKALLIQVEKERKKIKEPVLDFAAKIDKTAKEFREELEAEELRLNTAIGDYQQEQIIIARRAEAERQAEIRRIEEQRREEEYQARKREEQAEAKRQEQARAAEAAARRDREAAEAEAARKAKEAREAAAKAQREAEEKAAKERAEAEAKAKAAREAQEGAKTKAAREKAAREAAQAEKEAKEAEARAKAERERLEAEAKAAEAQAKAEAEAAAKLAEQRAAEERERLERERLAGEAKRREEEEAAAARAEQAKEALGGHVTAQTAPGQNSAAKWDYKVIDVWKLTRGAPGFVKPEPIRSAILEAINVHGTREIPGLEIFEVVKTTVSTRGQKVIDV